MFVLSSVNVGFLREGALIDSLMDAGPMLIIPPFRQQYLFNRYLDNYHLMLLDLLALYIIQQHL